MALENIHRVDGRVPKIPQAKCRITGGGYHEPLGRVCTTVCEFLVMPYNTTKDDKSARSPICRYSQNKAFLKNTKIKKQSLWSLLLIFIHCKYKHKESLNDSMCDHSGTNFFPQELKSFHYYI